MQNHYPAVWVAALLAMNFSHAAPETVDLFNGRDLAGWTQRGGKATYKAEGNVIVGTSVMDTPNSFLCTDKTYGDFILEYDFKVDPRLNSGVQIRSQCFTEETEVKWDGKSFKIPAGRVHGYQVEIDPDMKGKRMWSAGIYDEGRRGWLFPASNNKGQCAAFSEQGLRIFKPGDWNHVRVVAIGDSIRTFLNGELRADIKDSLTARGFIGLQVHAIGKDKEKEGAQVRWRNLKIADLNQPVNILTEEEKAAGCRLPWNGQNTAGWRSKRGEVFAGR